MRMPVTMRRRGVQKERRKAFTSNRVAVLNMHLLLTAAMIGALLATAAARPAHGQTSSAGNPSTAVAIPLIDARDVQSPSNDDYAAALTAILQHIVMEDGSVRYGLLRRSLADEFRRVLKAIEEFDARSLRSDEEKLAFWMNAYNVHMLKNIVEAPDATHILDDGYADRFFESPLRTARKEVTLDQIEHVVLRRKDGPPELMALRVDTLDPRLHVGINCAAVSCPSLRRRAFTPENVNEELNRAMRDFTRSEQHIRMDGGIMVMSAILDWFGTDFDRPDRPAGDFLLAYMPRDRVDYAALRARLEGNSAAEIKRRPDVRFEYDWTVNRAQPNSRAQPNH